ncbi:MAG: hypothetical protein DRN04_12960 [Thermoprotei archaeon]|nr:MAG: hypothetical protein DRN04_12960 [Thermoprotei archaeon]
MPHIFVSKEVYVALRKLKESRGVTYSEVIEAMLKENKDIGLIMEEQLHVLKQIYSLLLRIEERLASTKPLIVEKESKAEVTKELPSFIVDNPWVSVLASKRN